MTKSRKIDDLDVLIIGGGPAGLSAFQWCRELGMSAVIIERSGEAGGQLLSIHNPITNYLGRTASNGSEILSHFLSQIDGFEPGSMIDGEVVELSTSPITAALSTGEAISARAAVIATGVRRRQLGVSGETRFVGHGILESGAKDKEKVNGKRVAIIGGGDAALENAQILAEFAEKVYVIHRRSEFSARPEFVKAAAENESVEFLFNSVVTRFDGGDDLSAIQVSTDSLDQTIEVDAALVRIGVQPNTEFLRGMIELDNGGYIRVDHIGATSVMNIFAAGDVANPESPTISTSVGNGATVAKYIHHLLCDKRGL